MSESQFSNFDLFRLNCFLSDSQANDFKRIVISLVNEFLFDKNNSETSLSECYNHLISYHKIEIDKDYFESIIGNNDSYEQTPIQNDVLIKLGAKKYNSINEKLKEHSIEVYIEAFLKKRHYSMDLLQPIKSLLYQAVFENIHTFSTENLSSLITANIQKSFKQEQVNVFNEFLDDKDHEKNIAVYNVFLKATEFAIITSGKGIKEFSKDLFNGKTYCLDTNILFRLLGIGGEERRLSLVNLVRACIHQGIKFEYTPFTYKELKAKLTQIVGYLKSAELKYDFNTMGDLTISDPHLFNEDFIVHYSKLRVQGTISSPDQYELRLLADFRSLESELGFSLTKQQINITDKEQSLLADHLFKSRKTLPYGFKYSRTAASIDAYNILYVRKFRGPNNYNYADVKSFYLSTDRTLNNILSKDSGIKVPETILPSQLFILHNPSSNGENEIDYELFLQFVKRRTTEFHLNGGQVLSYINTIRKQTTSPEQLKDILRVYADQRYEVSEDYNIAERKVKPIQEVIETVLDQQLTEGRMAQEKLEAQRTSAVKQLPRILRNTKWTVRCIDILLTVALIPITLVIVKAFTTNLWALIGWTLGVEILKLLITSRTRVLPWVWEKILLNQVKSTSYYKVTSDNSVIALAVAEYKNVSGDIWKRKL